MRSRVWCQLSSPLTSSLCFSRPSCDIHLRYKTQLLQVRYIRLLFRSSILQIKKRQSLRISSSQERSDSPLRTTSSHFGFGIANIGQDIFWLQWYHRHNNLEQAHNANFGNSIICFMKHCSSGIHHTDCKSDNRSRNAGMWA